MQPFALANIHQRFLQVLQIVFGKVVLVSSLAVDWPFGVGLRLYIEFAQAVDYDVGMDVACSVIAICMGADQSLMPRKISFCVCAGCGKSGNAGKAVYHGALHGH
jgi:hypothetical protein